MSVLKSGLSIAAIVVLSGGAAQGQTSIVIGTVHAVGSDGKPFAMPGVRLTLTCASEAPSTTVTNDQGQFMMANVPIGSCALLTDVQGFKPATASLNHLAAELIDLSISLESEVLYTGLTVTDVPLDVASRLMTSSANVSGCKAPVVRTSNSESARE